MDRTGSDRTSTVGAFSASRSSKPTHLVAKALYGLLFDWLVHKVNQSLFKGETAVHFGVLDIFGFETFAVNR